MRFGGFFARVFQRSQNQKSEIRGQEFKMAFSRTVALGYLRRAHEQKRLAHAYLISGPPGSGKRDVAAELASLVNGTDPADVFSTNAREIFLAEPESKSRRIVIEQIRELEHTLQMQVSNGRRKVAIISEADRLQPQAANAFLKTLEEPPRNSLLLLLSALPEALPDTIVSRCISIPLAANGEQIEMPERAELIDLLGQTARENKWSVQQAYRVAQGMQSLLGEIREQIKAQTAEALLEFWSDVLRASSKVARRDLIAAKKETAALAERFTAPEVLRRIQRLEELRDHLGRNIQEALAFEAAFLQVFGS